ncbi:DUF4870 domain-containing protein [Chitinophaga sancti]|uniref:DUF4870 domain-containing protein n=1 Tax=Chitinophaga sancti TaxID=1004 RepID=A0A1K1SBP0_9BACT|nr:DUF4870 domain-containing protein [Chitinophaga sancti]WQD63518.1 DUF4870 domain-containing protein [Chitinophaga sancti]WQG90856.1 DUF4870 domain-containing protein [Chitinophaga sancti]SFW81508.1 hypothetical protein SAMN05661012_05086 [Chitinophaga sancti]
MNQKDERTWAVIISLGGIIGMTIGWFSPVGNIIAVLILWLIKRDQSSLLNAMGKEALNFQITMSILVLIVNFIFFILSAMWTFSTFFWTSYSSGFHFSAFKGRNNIVFIINLIFSIIAAVRANNGELYRYPFSWRIVK